VTVIDIPVPAPLAHQLPAYESPARFKVLRWGRRAGKDRLDFTASIAGHGPLSDDGEPLWSGAAQGWWVAWLVRDFTQGRGIWLEEFLPRFGPARPLVQTNETEMRVTLPNGGGVFLCTDKNINSIRGLGKRLKGLVANEAAWFDLESAWLSVIRPMLVDNRGWSILSSTTNSGHDGNPNGITPSYFNRLCLKIRAGEMGPDWAEFYATARDNPALDQDEVEAMIAEYPRDSLQVREEVFAELVPAGVGLAFPEWDPSAHLLDAFAIPQFWRVVGGMDWGLRAPSVVHLAAYGPEDDLVLLREWTWTDKDAYEAGYDLASAMLVADLPGWPETIWADSAMAERTGVGGRTILQEFQAGVDDALRSVANAPPLPISPIPKGPGSRALGYNLVAKALSWGPRLADGSLPRDRQPRLRMLRTHDRPACPLLATDLATLPRDPKDTDDVDDSRGGGHAYDACRYLLMGTRQVVRRPVRDIPQDVHPGYLPNGRLRSRARTPEVEREEARIVASFVAEQAQQRLGGRYGSRPR